MSRLPEMMASFEAANPQTLQDAWGWVLSVGRELPEPARDVFKSVFFMGARGAVNALEQCIPMLVDVNFERAMRWVASGKPGRATMRKAESAFELGAKTVLMLASGKGHAALAALSDEIEAFTSGEFEAFCTKYGEANEPSS